MSTEALKRTQTWLQEIVIGLNFCPFAQAAFDEQKIRFAVSDAEHPDDAIQFALSEALKLLETSEDEIATTLAVYPKALSDFQEYLEILGLLESLLEEAGTEGVLQIASFHPSYCYPDEPESGLSHYTNRSRYPIFHFLREAQVQEAVDSHPDSTTIPRANITRLEEMGPEEVAKRWKDLLDR